MPVGNTVENWLIDAMTPTQIRYVTPIPPAKADGDVAKLYRQARRDFQALPPLAVLSPTPDLMAALWTISRESYFVV